MADYGRSYQAVLKTKLFSNEKFHGIKKDTLHLREVACYRMDRDLLYFGIVPETVLTRYNGDEASAQRFVHGYMARDIVPDLFNKELTGWKFRLAKLFAKLRLTDLHKVVILDLIVNNTDRHGKNLLFVPPDYRISAIDNGLAFGKAYRFYRSVLHRYGFFSNFILPEWAKDRLQRITFKKLQGVLRDFLSVEEIEYTYWRIQFVLEHALDLSFRALSHGRLGKSDFPSYEKWFWSRMQPNEPEYPVVVKAEFLTNQGVLS